MDLKKYIGIYDKVFPLKTLSIFLKYINTLDFEDAGVVGNNKQQFIRKDIRNTKSKFIGRIFL